MANMLVVRYVIIMQMFLLSRYHNPNAYKDDEGNGGENNEEKDKTEESKQPSKTAMVEE